MIYLSLMSIGLQLAILCSVYAFLSQSQRQQSAVSDAIGSFYQSVSATAPELSGNLDSGEREQVIEASTDIVVEDEAQTRPTALTNKSNSKAAELTIDLRDVDSVEGEVLSAAGYGTGKWAAKAKRSWDMNLWPAFLRRCGLVDERAIAPGLRDGESAFPLGCARWEYEMFAEQLFGPQCLGALVNRAARRVLVTSRTQALYPTRVHWSVCHGWCRDPRLAHPTCLAAPIDPRPIYVFYRNLDDNHLFRVRVDYFNAEQCACRATDSVVPRNH